jgi:outer membrane lipoprotein SlyB
MVLALVLGASCAGCSAMHPSVYPNEHYRQVGGAQADRDIADCEAKADSFVKSGGHNAQMAMEAGRNAGVGAAVGAASGAVGGAIYGNAAEGAAAGAAGGATAGLVGTLFGWMVHKSEPEPVYRNFVEQCLHDKGYQPIGWN